MKTVIFENFIILKSYENFEIFWTLIFFIDFRILKFYEIFR